MSSVGHHRQVRRPSLADWTEQTSHHRYNNSMESNIPQYIYAYFPGQDLPETVPVEPGMRLHEVFDFSLRSRGLNYNEVELFVENSKTPIPDTADVKFLVGQRVVVKRRGAMRVSRHSRATHSMDDGDRPQRKMSAEAISRKTSFVNSKKLSKARQPSEVRMVGSEDPSERSNDSSLRDISMLDDTASCSNVDLPLDDGGTRRARSIASSRISLFFNKEKNDFMARLQQFKENTSQAPLPGLELEEHWKEIVTDPDLPKRCQSQQEAVWELVTTEKRYIEILKNMAALKSHLTELQNHGYLKDIRPNKVFLNYENLLATHRRFWETAILPMLTHSRETGEPLQVVFLELWFGEVMNWPCDYSEFTSSHNECIAYVQKKQKENDLFACFVSWAESQDQMRRSKLCDTITMPMQRLTRYPMMLKAIRSCSTDDEEKTLLQAMSERADAAAQMVNIEMNNNDLRHQLEEVMSQIESYDCVDQDEFEKLFPGQRCSLDLTQYMPMLHPQRLYRRLFYRGELKVREGRPDKNKESLYCLIFTDLFLICRKKADRLRIVRPPIHISNVLYHSFQDTYGFNVLTMNVFGSVDQFYMMSTGGFEETKRWLEMLHMAREEWDRFHQYSQQLLLDRRDSPIGDPRRMNFGSPMHSAISIAHKKSSSMDSAHIAANAQSNQIHRLATVSSTEQLDRHSESARLPPRHKLSVASCIANPLSSSKSSVDLHLNLGAETSLEAERPRSRSNSSGPDIDGNGKRQSRSSSPQRRNQRCPSPTPAPDELTTNSPTLLVTSEEDPPSSQGRRFEKRYHTSDGIDIVRGKPSGAPAGSILKRFSWNVSSAVGASSRKISAKLGEHSRRHSQASTAASSESFGSSTSGISSGSSQHDHQQNEIIRTHISTVAVNESPAESTLNISLEAPDDKPVPPTEASPPAPPLPDLPPPPPYNKHSSDLLKFIMDAQLETSDV